VDCHEKLVFGRFRKESCDEGEEYVKLEKEFHDFKSFNLSILNLMYNPVCMI